MSKSAEFWNCLYYTELLLQPIFNELSALAVEVSCFLKLTSTDFSPREKKLRSEKKLRQKIRSLLLVVLLLKKPKHFARKKNNIKEHRKEEEEDRLIIVSLCCCYYYCCLLLLLFSSSFYNFVAFASGSIGVHIAERDFSSSSRRNVDPIIMQVSEMRD